jgi:membrane-bound ClpP family serine protease
VARRHGSRAEPGRQRGAVAIVLLILVLFPLLGLLLFFLEPLRLAFPAYLLGLAASAVLWRAALRSRRLPVHTGREALVGREVVVVEWTGSAGWVRCGGERWHAVVRGRQPVQLGDMLRVVAVDGLTLVVEPTPS